MFARSAAMMLMREWMYSKVVSSVCYLGDSFSCNQYPLDALNFIRDISRKDELFGATQNRLIYYLLATAQDPNHQVELLEELDPRQMETSAIHTDGKAKLQYMQFCVSVGKFITASRETGMKKEQQQQPLDDAAAQLLPLEVPAVLYPN